MANQKITIDVGTSWNGEGMSRAMGAVDQLSKTAKKSAGAVGQLTGALGGLGGKAGQVVGAVTGLTGALAAGGWAGLAVAGVTSVITVFRGLHDELEASKEQIRKWEEEARKAKRAAEEWMAALNEQHLDKAVARNADLASSMRKVASGYEDVASAQKKLANSTNQLQAAQMESGGASKEEVAQKLGEGRIAQADADVAAKGRALQLARDLETRAKVATDQARFAAGSSVNNESVQRKLKDLELKQFGATKAREKAELELAAAQADRAKAELDVKKSVDHARAEDDAAHDAEMRTTWEEIGARVEIRNQKLDEAKAERDLRDAIGKDRGLQDELTSATEDLKNAEYGYANALRRAEAAAQNATWQGWSANNGIPESQIVGNGMNGQSRYGARNNASIHDAGYNARVQAGYERNARSQGYGLSARDAKELGRLELMGDDISDADRRRRADLRARDPEWQKAQADRRAQAAKDALDAAKERKDAAERAMQQNVADIKRMMEKLGLK